MILGYSWTWDGDVILDTTSNQEEAESKPSSISSKKRKWYKWLRWARADRKQNPIAPRADYKKSGKKILEYF